MVHIFVIGSESGPVGDSPGTSSNHNKGLLHDRWVYCDFNKKIDVNVNNNIPNLTNYLFSFFILSIYRFYQQGLSDNGKMCQSCIRRNICWWAFDLLEEKNNPKTLSHLEEKLLQSNFINLKMFLMLLYSYIMSEDGPYLINWVT